MALRSAWPYTSDYLFNSFEILTQRFYASQSSAQKEDTSTTQQTASTVNAKEAQKFAKLAAHWWDLQGPLRPLHQLNPTRCSFIRTSLCDNYGLDPTSLTPLSGLKLLDVGCGGGILSEALARMGAHVHGIDVNPEGIAAAQAHAALGPSFDHPGRLQYSTTKVEDIVKTEKERFDAVIASEVIEHVASVPAFCTALIQATAPGGAIVISTLNRTIRAYALAVVAAEQVLQWAPPGTHEWSKFLTPEELVLAMEEAGEREGKSVSLEQVSGMVFDPLKGQWGLGRDVGINYIAFFRKAAG
ncbi:putative Ubiquinone biosynthesis O-methyltransferase, mitochondrial [Nannochloris sp. 'desiccata']|nr:hypothetical protein KSW81_008305 [Chlorella desiccata (nom. nud.)]KAH7619593.1 putative Ubiquinone biosynthesis O-methyltransferase, mitochondrial [Chlorella desiccata (nom. nud.)]